MKTLVMAATPEARDVILRALKTRKLASSDTESLQQAIELLETSPADFGLVICDYHSKSGLLFKTLLEATATVPCLILLDPSLHSPPEVQERHALLRTIAHGDYETLDVELDRLVEDGLFTRQNMPDEKFVRVATAGLDLDGPLAMDIFVKLAPGRYCKRFKKNDQFSASDLEENFKKRSIEAFYILKTEVDTVVDRKSEKTDQLLAAGGGPEEEKARTLALENLELVHDVVQELGFTPKMQELAKKTVSLLVKVLGGSPKLSAILTKLRKQEGKYIASHSMMLAEISCAMAARVGLNSATTFMKLGLSAFLHDLSLTDNRIAQLSTREQIERTSLTTKQLQDVKSHPAKSAEFARKFHQIPPDVDTIIFQHHERPDGSGFPRGLLGNQMPLLTCLFIMSEDLLEFYLKTDKPDDVDTMLEAFLDRNADRYSSGPFRKLRDSLDSGTPLQL